MSEVEKLWHSEIQHRRRLKNAPDSPAKAAELRQVNNFIIYLSHKLGVIRY